jgi:mannose-1-phosphate guanylyltransferase
VLHDAPGFNNVSVDSRGRIIDMRDMLKPDGVSRRLAYSGICFLSTEILRFFPAGESDLVLILLDIIKKGSAAVQAIITQQCAWSDVGSPASYLRAHRDILIGRQPLIDAACMPRSAVYAGSGTRIGSSAALAGFVSAGDCCKIDSGCSLENCIVWDGAQITEGAAFKNAIIGPGWAVQVQEAF